ncbi:YciI family protein Ecym_4509 [Eremothecium cymbalariae DBVPG|uniref:YCII-related domain-containing protein n=1 Tax=Eremothecium cymbalariae (strain CBS 270.75 / DBVPG 7215 / KCTC 17166 / NRRL Y-17582) TaxID=931890 RepID=G8JU43_ERECY|nr:hypothetical protein Ecym_4509 [Eremothecium cymbalariae DBVPG\
MVEWCVTVYDKPGSDRSPYRSMHLERIPELVQEGKIVVAGAIYKDLVDGKPGGFAGSHLILVADTREEVVELLKGDIYAKEGVWDMDNILIFPFGCAVRKEKQ